MRITRSPHRLRRTRTGRSGAPDGGPTACLPGCGRGRRLQDLHRSGHPDDQRAPASRRRPLCLHNLERRRTRPEPAALEPRPDRASPPSTPAAWSLGAASPTTRPATATTWTGSPPATTSPRRAAGPPARTSTPRSRPRPPGSCSRPGSAAAHTAATSSTQAGTTSDSESSPPHPAAAATASPSSPSSASAAHHPC